LRHPSLCRTCDSSEQARPGRRQDARSKNGRPHAAITPSWRATVKEEITRRRLATKQPDTRQEQRTTVDSANSLAGTMPSIEIAMNRMILAN
jgi:hypothetical protein